MNFEKLQMMPAHIGLTLLLTGMITLFSAFMPVDPQPLDIKIINVGNKAGKIVVEIYNSKTSWLKSPYRRMVLSTNQDFQIASFDVPYGKYAVSIYHDTNGNGKLDMGIFSIPKEPIGFGNNYKPFGKPKFESALIDYKATSKPQEIKLFTVF